MPHWSQKNILYKAGVIGLCGGFVLFLIGFGAPAWMKFDKGFYSGLWMECDSKLSDCVSYNNERLDAWLSAARAMEAITFVIYLAILAVAFMFNFTAWARNSVKEHRVLEVLSIAAGVAGIIGATVFGIKKPGKANVTWAFGLVVTACCIALICAFLIALSPPATTQDPPVAACTAPVRKSFPVIQMGYEPTPWASSSEYNPPTGRNNVQVVNAPPNQRVAQNYYAPALTAGYNPPAQSHDQGSRNYYTSAPHAEHNQPTQSYGPGSQSYYSHASARPYRQQQAAYATGISGSPIGVAENDDDPPPPYESHFQNYNERGSHGDNYGTQTNRTYDPHRGHRREDREMMKAPPPGDGQLYI